VECREYVPSYQALSETLEQEVLSVAFYAKGQIGEIYKVQTSEHLYILKTSEPSSLFAIEANMLKDIHKYNVSVPRVYDMTQTHLLMEYIESVEQAKSTQEIEAAKILSQLHSVSNESRMYGYYYNTSIGPFTQKNEQTQYNWTLFLGQMRILPMAQICYDRGLIDKTIVEKLENLCRDLYKRIDMSKIEPSLLHGDMWAGNMLFTQKRAVLIDPAIYFGDKEMDLAYIRMFDTFGERFFRAYSEIHPLSEEYYEIKEPLYQIYPLLVHVALYGGMYVKQLTQLLIRIKI